MPLLDAAGTACKLVLLASSDADHRALLGIAEAAPANGVPFCPPCRPNRPIELAAAACQAAADCVQRVMRQPSALPPEQHEYARRWASAAAIGWIPLPLCWLAPLLMSAMRLACSPPS